MNPIMILPIPLFNREAYSPLSRLLYYFYSVNGADTMSRAIYIKNEYMIIKSRHGHVIINTHGTFAKNHGHVKKLSTCKMLIGLVVKGIVPDSPYLRETAIRISLDEKYKNKIKNRIEKDKNKNYYINVQKGVRK